MATTTRTFTADELNDLELDWLDTAGNTSVVHIEDIGHGRWYRYQRVVFTHDGQLWRIRRQQPLTEIQEKDPWNGDDTVTATLVEPYQETVTRYQPVDPDRPIPARVIEADHASQAADLLDRAGDLELPAETAQAQLMVTKAGVHAQLAALATARDLARLAGQGAGGAC